MRKTTLTMGALLGALCLGSLACEEQTPPPPPTKPADKPSAKPADKPADKPAAKVEKLTGDKLAARVKECYAAMDAKDDKKFADCHAADAKFEMVDSLPAMTAQGVDKIMANHKMWAASMPDMSHEIGVLLINGQNVVTIASVHGKNTGEMFGKPATNKEVGMLFSEVVKVTDDGKAQDLKLWVDQSTMMSQLGLTPPEAAAMARPVWAKGQWGETVVVIAKNDQKEKDNVALYDKSTEAFNKHEVDAVAAMYADDVLFRDTSAKEDIKGLDNFKKGLGDFYKMSSDVKSTVTWKWAAGDYVAVGTTVTGTFDGSPDPKMKPTKKTFTLNGMEVVKVASGKIAEHWMFANGYKFAVDVGLAPPPEAAPATADAKGDPKAAEPKTKPATAPGEGKASD